jgi:hypothetical protein
MRDDEIVANRIGSVRMYVQPLRKDLNLRPSTHETFRANRARQPHSR